MEKKLDTTLAPAYEVVRSAEARTGRDRIIYAKNCVLKAINELEKTDAYGDEETRIPGIVRMLESAEDSLADMLND